jgi:hypothetical protein
MEISMLGSSAAAALDAFSFWHIPGQRGKESVVSGQLSVVSARRPVHPEFTNWG